MPAPLVVTVLAIFAPLLQWFLREAVIKVLLIIAIYEIMYYLFPLLLHYLSPFLGIQNLTAGFAGLSSGVWFFIDYFGLDYGIPVVISAYCARFLIRRIPFIG